MANVKLDDFRIKPRILIADDSRIVRAALIKHIQGMFDFREAFDGEHAWETLLIDPTIRVLITDLTMPKLDGYGLLLRIRASRISRIRNLPVVVISGSDEQAERERAKAAGATELITKGIGTAQLLSHLEVVSRLVATQQDFERGLEQLVQSVSVDGESSAVGSHEAFLEAARAMQQIAIPHGKPLFVLNIALAVHQHDAPSTMVAPPLPIMHAVGALLRRTIRGTDCIGKSGESAYTLAISNANLDSARGLANRLCAAISKASLIDNPRVVVTASCGIIQSDELVSVDPENDAATSIEVMSIVAHRRANLGLNQGVSGVVGIDEERAFQNLLATTSAN